MIQLSTTKIAVNPPGMDVRLSRADLWRGLVWKAEEPMAFGVPINECVILERFSDGFLRRIMHLTPAGTYEPIEERIILDPENQLTLIRLTGRTVGRIINEISENAAGALALQFHAILGLPTVPHGGLEEVEYRKQFGDGYQAAAESTLDVLRELARTGVDSRSVSARR